MTEPSDGRRPVILDVDTGIGDMVALLIAATAPELNLRGVTCVAGNVELQHVARNTGTLLQMVGRGDIPVSIGAARPLNRRLRTAPETHGPTGTGYAELRGEQRVLETTDFTAIPAARYLEAHLTRHPGQMTVIATGPLTNLASAAGSGVDLAGGAREVIWMGGALNVRGTPPRPGNGMPASIPKPRRRACRAARSTGSFRWMPPTSPCSRWTTWTACGHRAGQRRPRRGPLLRGLPPGG
jgi:inosine-uridine nucleoside N-ribohydrolase